MKLRKRSFPGTVSDAVTNRETANRRLARKAAAEGFVLLKNENHFLPLKKKSKSVFTVPVLSGRSRAEPDPVM